MKISAEDVKLLREKTGAGLMECKKALVASDGDFNKAIQYLKDHSGPHKCILVR